MSDSSHKIDLVLLDAPVSLFVFFMVASLDLVHDEAIGSFVV